jgi:intein/homing endonuclease
MIAKELGYEGPIYQYESTDGHLASSLSFTSKKIRQTIESYGIGNNKTFKLHNLPDNLPKEFLVDYIRGFFDGDGSIYEPKGKKIGMSFTCASDTFL